MTDRAQGSIKEVIDNLRGLSDWAKIGADELEAAYSKAATPLALGASSEDAILNFFRWEDSTTNRSTARCLIEIIAAPLRAEVEALKEKLAASDKALWAVQDRRNELREHTEHVKAFLNELAETLGLMLDPSSTITIKNMCALLLNAAKDNRQWCYEAQEQIAALKSQLHDCSDVEAAAKRLAPFYAPGYKTDEEREPFMPYLRLLARAALEPKSGEVGVRGSVQGQAGAASDPVLPASPEPSASAGTAPVVERELITDTPASGSDPAPAAPPGWKLVPVEMSTQQYDALSATNKTWRELNSTEVYRVLVASAPPCPITQDSGRVLVPCWANACEGNFSTSFSTPSRAFTVPREQCKCVSAAMMGR